MDVRDVTIHVLLLATVLAADPPGPPAEPPQQGPAPGEAPATAGTEETAGEDIAQEPVGGAGVSPIEIVPRLEIRQSFQRLVLRFDVPYRVLGTPAGQVSGVGDIQVSALGIVDSTPLRLVAIVAGL